MPLIFANDIYITDDLENYNADSYKMYSYCANCGESISAICHKTSDYVGSVQEVECSGCDEYAKLFYKSVFTLSPKLYNFADAIKDKQTFENALVESLNLLLCELYKVFSYWIDNSDFSYFVAEFVKYLRKSYIELHIEDQSQFKRDVYKFCGGITTSTTYSKNFVYPIKREMITFPENIAVVHHADWDQNMVLIGVYPKTSHIAFGIVTFKDQYNINFLNTLLHPKGISTKKQQIVFKNNQNTPENITCKKCGSFLNSDKSCTICSHVKKKKKSMNPVF